jgi:hypothetical protein
MSIPQIEHEGSITPFKFPLVVVVDVEVGF